MKFIGLESFQSLYEDLGDLMNQGFIIYDRNRPTLMKCRSAL